MFQKFDADTSPTTCARRLHDLRAVLAAQGLAGFLVPRSDLHQGEYVAPCDERLAWLTSFTGSAGAAAVLMACAALFVDGRYVLQAPQQTDTQLYDIQQIPHQTLTDWLNDNAPSNAVIGYDPWLYSVAQLKTLREKLRDDVQLRAIDNPIDAIWADQPDAPLDPIVMHPVVYAGDDMAQKLAALAGELQAHKQTAAIFTTLDSIAWLLNIRGSDLDRTPVARAMAIVYDSEDVDLFAPLAKIGDELRSYFGDRVTCYAPDQFVDRMAQLSGPVRLDRDTCPVAVDDILSNAGVARAFDTDLTILPKACKNQVEQDGARDAHLRDGVAMVKLLAWLDGQDVAQLDEIRIVQQLEQYRRGDETLKNIAFDTICGSGPNGAIVHYRVTRDSNRQLCDGDVLLIDSGGQYLSGTTDITRTIAMGGVDEPAKRAFTLVLKGMIALSRLHFPTGRCGRDVDAVARQFLWMNGMDYDHGTGHGVGSYLSVHEGPASISSRSNVALRAGMIISNEPGYYAADAYGIRIENLLLIKKVPAQANRDMLGFETLTYVPIDRNMMLFDLLSQPERDWLNAYHDSVYERLAPLLDGEVLAWLKRACAPV